MRGTKSVLELRLSGLCGAIIFVSLTTGIMGFAAGAALGFGLSREAGVMEKEEAERR